MAVRPRLRKLHAEVDRAVRRLEKRHAERLRCGRGCADCCVDDITVFPVEADAIRRHHPTLLAEGTPHPPGRCAFLDPDGACRIYEQRPYVCRTQGVPLRWVDQGPSGEPVEYRDICPLNAEGPALESLAVDDCWTLGPVEAQLVALQGPGKAGEPPERTPLRSLFRRGS